jgi:hypothetical protein
VFLSIDLHLSTWLYFQNLCEKYMKFFKVTIFSNIEHVTNEILWNQSRRFPTWE